MDALCFFYMVLVLVSFFFFCFFAKKVGLNISNGKTEIID